MRPQLFHSLAAQRSFACVIALVVAVTVAIGCATRGPAPPPGSGLTAMGVRAYYAPDDWLYKTQDGRVVTLHQWREERAEARRGQVARTNEHHTARAELARKCIAGAGPLWARFVIAETPDESISYDQRCPAPDGNFLRLWASQPIPSEIVDEMFRCLDAGRGRAACEAEALPRIDEAKATARARLPGVGTFFGGTAKTYKTAEGCTWFETGRLTLDIDAWGQASWFAHLYVDADCSDPSNAQPLTCARGGKGRVVVDGSTTQLITEERTALPAPTLSTIHIWKCGRVRLRMPAGWMPEGELSRLCLRTGEEPDRAVEVANAVACQHSQVFPELGSAGVAVQAAGANLVLQLANSQLTLQPGKTAAPAPSTSPAAP